MSAIFGAVGLDAGTRRLLGSLGPFAFEELAGAPEAIAWARGDAAEQGLLLIGPEVNGAVRLAERVRALHRKTEVVLCAHPEREAALRRELTRSPWLGARVPCLSLAEPDAIADALRSALARGARRARHRAVVAASETRLPTLAVKVKSHRSRYLDQLWSLLPLGTLVVAASDGRVLEANAQAGRLLDLSEEQLLGRRLDELLPGSARERLLAALASAAGAEIRVESVALEIPGAGPRYLDAMITGPDVEQSRLVLLHDVTDRRLTEEELLRRLAQIEQQQEEIRQLSTPLIQVWSGVLALPVIGRVDRERADRLMQDLLEAVSAAQARAVIVDLTGAHDVDATTASALLGMVRAAGLLGARCLLSGVSPDVARTLVAIGVDLGSLSVCQTLHAALRSLIR